MSKEIVENGEQWQELSSYSSFQKVVIDGQARWKAAHRNPLAVVSQAVELPKILTSKIHYAVINNLPNYLPDNLPKNLRDSHPTPIIGYSANKDPRIEKNITNLESVTIVYPEHLKSVDEKRQWLLGIRTLDEFVTESVTLDILEKFYSEKLSIFPEPVAKMYNEITSKVFEQPAYSQVFEMLERIYGGRHSYSMGNLKEKLATAAFTTESGNHNQFYKITGKTELDMACSTWSNPQIDNFTDLVMQLGKRTTPPKEDTENPFERWLKKIIEPKISVLGCTSLKYPGVINCFGSHSIERAHRVILHEMVHYLSTDLDHAGLMPVKFSKA